MPLALQTLNLRLDRAEADLLLLLELRDLGLESVHLLLQVAGMKQIIFTSLRDLHSGQLGD